MYPQVFGKYVLERELSRGGMARVVLATLRGAGGFEKKLVVKQIRDELSFDQQFVRRFVEEAKTTVALSHPNIVPVYELGVEQGTYFLAMELVEGCSVAELVKEKTDAGKPRVLSPEEGAYIGMELCRALDYAHRRMKVVHRDITPRNVMLDEEGQVKLIDFGIAAPALVAGHEILGSPGHMPPEQVEGKSLGPPTDIFAVAVLLMEAWTGVPPFRRGTPEECDAAMRAPHPRPSDFDPRLIPLDDVIMRAMKLEPVERQQEANELGRALRAFLQGVDESDIARALGDRVARLRERASLPPPTSLPGRDVRPPNPSVGDMGTKTFAAREEAIRWSQPPPSEVVPLSHEPPAASTRRLEVGSEPKMASDAPGIRLASLATPREAKVDPALSVPTPLMVENDAKGSEILEAAARAQERAAREAAKEKEGGRVRDSASDRESMPTPLGGVGVQELKPQSAVPTVRRKAVSLPDPRNDTLATSPLETPVEPTSPQPAAPRSRTWLVVAVGALAIGMGFAAWRARVITSEGNEGKTPPPAVTSAGPTATPPTTASAPSAPSGPSSAIVIAPPTPSLGTTGAPPTAHTAPTTSVTGATSATEKAGRALVTFLGEPGTRVSVDGVARGPCPVRVSLEPGQHDARFSFDPTSESLSEGFRVKAGEKMTVRAEFTGARPTVRIQR
ncbi:MAG: protein kinase [Deltaproteobacteria bacterium]|nr:protein kinase [Deltaproteobacteria bacterium]